MTTRAPLTAPRWSAVMLATAIALAAGCAGAKAAVPDGPWTPGEQLQPAELVATLKGPAPKPAILYVGFRALYVPGHIPGAIFIGPSSQPAGLVALKEWAASHPKDATVVIYCGCCPFDHCPNVVPAYSMLKQLGFTRIRVLMLPTNFEVDWVNRAYPLERQH